MRESNTQKNWKDYWKDYEPTREDMIYRNPRRSSLKINRYTISGTAGLVLMIALIIGRNIITNQVYHNNVSSSLSSSTSIYESDKVGETMATSIDTIVNMLNDISKNQNSITSNELITDESKIRNLDLSADYDNVKSDTITKLQYMEQYVTLKTKYQQYPESSLQQQMNNTITQYNNINIINSITTVFDKLGITYSVSGNEIHYQYKR
jgi:hypothetical protein